jgi:hypothetical protein
LKQNCSIELINDVGWHRNSNVIYREIFRKTVQELKIKIK